MCLWALDFCYVMHVVILHLHPFGFGMALQPVPVVALLLHLLGNVLEDIPVPVPFPELALHILLTPDEVPHLAIVSVV